MSQKKTAVAYVCEQCGVSHSRWHGRCPSCGEWNSVGESVARVRKSSAVAAAKKPVRIGEVERNPEERFESGFGELDRVLGGGFVAGGVVLLGGDPGAGKSTLLMQALAALASRNRSALYVTGEESEGQVALRAERIGAHTSDVHVIATTELEEAEHAISASRPSVVVVDSIQTVRSSSLDSPIGTIGQLREVTARLIDIAKREGVALVLIGHVTKDGAIAGPKLLEHMVDTVLALEGDKNLALRILRCTKNRFGPSDETAVFEMTRDGMSEVVNPSAHFLAERPKDAAGSIVFPAIHGSRALLLELQALVAPAAYGAARRIASGLDTNRLAILLAVIERKADVHVLDRDVFASVAGGVRVEERAMDLALALAVVSSLREKAVSPEVAVFGELGLAGEVRAVPRASARLTEARRLGFKRVIVPRGNFDSSDLVEELQAKDIELVPVKMLGEALEVAFSR